MTRKREGTENERRHSIDRHQIELERDIPRRIAATRKREHSEDLERNNKEVNCRKERDEIRSSMRFHF